MLKKPRNRVFIWSGVFGFACVVIQAIGLDVEPVMVAEWPGLLRGPAFKCAVVGNYAYMACGSAGVIVLDVTNPSRPVRVGGWPPSYEIRDIAASGNLLFTANSVEGLHVLDVSLPTEPKRIGGYKTASTTYAGQAPVAVEGNNAYVITYDGTFYVIDIGTPSNPRMVGVVRTSLSPRNIVVAGAYAYVSDQQGLTVIEVSNPLRPAVVAALKITDGANSVSVSGSYAYVAAGSAGLQVVYISNPLNPRLLTSLKVGNYGGYAKEIAISENYAFLAAGPEGLHIVDVTNPVSPRLVGSIDTANQADGVVIRGNRAFVSHGGAGLKIIDVSNKTAPRLLGDFNTDGSAESVTISQQHAILADGNAGIQVFDLVNPMAPKWIGGFDTKSIARRVAVSGNHAFVADTWNGLAVVDISDFKNMKLVSTYLGEQATGGVIPVQDVCVAGNYAYMITSLRMEIADITNPAALRPISTMPFKDPRNSAFNDFYVYLADGTNGLEIIDVLNPAVPRLASRIDTGGEAYAIALSGGYAYVATSINGLQVIDVRNPNQPKRAGSLLFPNDRAINVSVSSNTACVSLDYEGLAIVDVQDPNNPKGVGRFSRRSASVANSTRATGLIGQLIYAVDSVFGLEVIDISKSGPSVLRLATTSGPDASGFHLSVSGPSGRSVQLQRSSDLKSWSDWQTLILTTPTTQIFDKETKPSHRNLKKELERFV